MIFPVYLFLLVINTAGKACTEDLRTRSSIVGGVVELGRVLVAVWPRGPPEGSSLSMSKSVGAPDVDATSEQRMHSTACVHIACVYPKNAFEKQKSLACGPVLFSSKGDS